jgi:hypothetical protein
MVGGLCKPSIKAIRNRVLLVAVPAKHLLVAQRPRDVQVPPPGTPPGCARGFDVPQFLHTGHESFHASLSQLREMATSVPPGCQEKVYHQGRDEANFRRVRETQGHHDGPYVLVTAPKRRLVFNPVR